MATDKTISAFPEGENLFKWIGTIAGPAGTVYEGLTYKLALQFPHSYPYSPPNVRFTTNCYHPNVDIAGNICLDILKEKWSALYDVRTILISIQSLLGGKNIIQFFFFFYFNLIFVYYKIHLIFIIFLCEELYIYILLYISPFEK